MSNFFRQATREVALAAAALAAMMIGAMPTAAMDQRAVEAQRNNATSWHAATPSDRNFQDYE